MRIQIFIDHDIILRHFILSGVLKGLEAQHTVQYVFAKDPRIQYDISQLPISNKIEVPIDRLRLSPQRDLAKAESLYRGRRKKEFGFVFKIWKSSLTKSHYRRLRIKSLPIIYPIFKKYQLKKLGENPALKKTISDFAPDIIVHPTVLEGLFISDLCFLSKEMNIPFVALMNSWDNPSTKACVFGTPDHLVVWGEQTKQHAIKFVGMKAESVHTFGSAQFEVYKTQPTVTKKEILDSIGKKENLTLIVYAGSSKSINEMMHLQILEKACESGQLKNCHIIFRPHPWRAKAENEPEFHDLTWKHVSIDPFMKQYFNNQKINLTNYIDTHNILSACDLLISNVSTIQLEASLHGKPVICMVSDEDINQSSFLKVVFETPYFEEMLSRLEIPRCRDHVDISDMVNNLLSNASRPDYVSSLIKKVDYFVKQTPLSYFDQLHSLLRDISKSKTSQIKKNSGQHKDIDTEAS